jgi:hypothetical protein
MISRTCNYYKCVVSVNNCLLLHLSDSESGQRQLKVISQRPVVTEEQKNQALQRAKQFKSKNPFGLQIMKESYVYVGFFLVILLLFPQIYYFYRLKNRSFFPLLGPFLFVCA